MRRKKYKKEIQNRTQNRTDYCFQNKKLQLKQSFLNDI